MGRVGDAQALPVDGHLRAATPARTLVDLLLDTGVDLVVTGHEHLYQRTQAAGAGPRAAPPCARAGSTPTAWPPRGRGTTFVTVGTGGPAARGRRGGLRAALLRRVQRGEPRPSYGSLDVRVTADRLTATSCRSATDFTDRSSSPAERRDPRVPDGRRVAPPFVPGHDGYPYGMSSAEPERVVVTLRPLGSPTALGLFGLAAATFTLAGLQLGWVPVAQGATVGLLLIGFAAPAQLLAAVLAFLARDAGIGTAMAVLSLTWLSTGLVLLTSEPGARSAALGLLLASSAVAVGVSGVTGLLTKISTGCVLLVAAVRIGLTSAYQLTGQDWLQTTAGASGCGPRGPGGGRRLGVRARAQRGAGARAAGSPGKGCDGRARLVLRADLRSRHGTGRPHPLVTTPLGMCAAGQPSRVRSTCSVMAWRARRPSGVGSRG